MKKIKDQWFNTVRKPFSPPREVHVQVTHSMPPQKIEIFKSMEDWAENNLLTHLKPVEKSWQPQDFLPDPASDGFHDQVKELPDDYFVVLCQSRRIQMLETRNNKEVDTALLNKWPQLSEAGNNEDWDDSVLTKDEAEARLQKKVEAVIKRERAMAYAYSHKLWKSNPKAAQSSLDIRSNGYPWWWNWLERQLPPATTSQSQIATKNFTSTPPRPISEYKPSPRLHEALTPQSSKSSIPTRAKQFQTPNRTPPPNNFKNSKPRASAANSTYDASLKDDDSLMSCPPFSAHPNYMTPTVSAKAKARANSNPKERLIGTPSNDSKRRFSFPMTPNIGSFKWNKGSNKISTPQRVPEKPQSPHSVGDMSLDSAVSMPARIGRKPFNRFV
ncbi:hypothetical protein ACJIZ3_021052 [Penstemon smallii]|uniref:DUF4005 domain-containing protein n=1 Tax=Penstemon smallii TaxID=265156 RepID=A0ABD3SKJ6_9LAMI